MAGFSGMTPDQQAQVLAFMPVFRSKVIELARAVNNMAALLEVWNTNVSVPVLALDAGTVIPDNTGLAGAQSVNREQIMAVMGAMMAALAAANTVGLRSRYISVIGPANMVA